MNRTDRPYALVEELRARAPRTMRAVELARRFEVSTRTIERDLLALQEAGVPIWARPGPGGGYGINVDELGRGRAGEGAKGTKGSGMGVGRPAAEGCRGVARAHPAATARIPYQAVLSLTAGTYVR